jgi:hypothetical protein
MITNQVHSYLMQLTFETVRGSVLISISRLPLGSPAPVMLGSAHCFAIVPQT